MTLRVKNVVHDSLDEIIEGFLQEGIEAKVPQFEFFWAAAKRHARENCEYSLQGLRDTIPLSLDSVSEVTIWRFYEKCQCTMRAYRDGYQYGTAGS